MFISTKISLFALLVLGSISCCGRMNPMEYNEQIVKMHENAWQFLEYKQEELYADRDSTHQNATSIINSLYQKYDSIINVLDSVRYPREAAEFHQVTIVFYKYIKDSILNLYADIPKYQPESKQWYEAWGKIEYALDTKASQLENNMIAELKRLPDTCGFVSFTQELNIQSTVGRRLFLNSDFLTDRPSIIRELSNTDSMLAFIDKEHHKKDIACILLLLSEVKDIEKTLTNLDSNKILNDIELFEIKNFSFTAKKLLEIVYRYTSNNELYIEGQKEVDFVTFDETIRILDPENSGIPTFYIYDAYSEDLAALRHREQNETDSEQLAEIQAQILDIEQEIRSSLSQQLKPHSNDLLTALNNIAYIDLLIAKAAMANSFGLCRPEVSENKTEYIGIFNPEVKAKLQERGSKYQETDIDFGRFPTLITGINMGGKTLMLKTLYLCQMLFQYGFFVPAGRAKIMIMSGILFSFTDEQNQLQGLSSFAAEMKKIDEIIKQISADHNLLILIDELARTTNPQEGAAIVSATLEILQENSVCAFITTHYDITTSCRRLRVRGLKENVSETASNYKSTDYIRNLLKNIDYQLINDTSGNTPNEAIRIAELLGTDNRLIDKAKGKIAH